MTTLPKSEDYFGQVGESDSDDNTSDRSADSVDDEIVSWTGDSDDEQDMPTLDQDSYGEEFDPPSPDLSESPITSLYSLSNTNTVDDISSKPSPSREYQYDPPQPMNRNKFVPRRDRSRWKCRSDPLEYHFGFRWQ